MSRIVFRKHGNSRVNHAFFHRNAGKVMRFTCDFPCILNATSAFRKQAYFPCETIVFENKKPALETTTFQGGS